jgi:hypothetical protein
MEEHKGTGKYVEDSEEENVQESIFIVSFMNSWALHYQCTHRDDLQQHTHTESRTKRQINI